MLPSRVNLGFVSKKKRNSAKQGNREGTKTNPQQKSIQSQEGDGSVSQVTS